MNRVKTTIFVLCISLMPSALDAAQTIGYMGYNEQTGMNDLAQTIIYQLPDSRRFGPGPYPVFMWTPGTYQSFQDVMAYTLITQMAARGFLAASVQYSNYNTIQSCPDYVARAESIYNTSRLTSAAGAICSLTGADCNKGIVTAGISQGGMISVLAKNYAPSVRASFAMSISDYNKSGIGVKLDCVDKPFTAIPANRLMIVNGQNDPYFGGQTPLENVSGFACPSGSTQCWSPDGSGAGWYIIQNSQVVDGNAEHCYQLSGDCSSGKVWDKNWYLPSTFNWSLKPNLDWLSSFGTRRVFSATGQ